jgi:flagellar protein FlbD
MILLTRLNGAPFAINADLIERIETSPDTIVSLVDGRKYVVAESAQDVIDRVVGFRAAILVAADRMHADRGEPPSDRRLRLVPGASEE